jgi:hypothetical protein
MSLFSPRRRRAAGVRLLSTATAVLLLAACPPPGLSGTYEAKQPEGTFTIDFKSGGKVEMTMQETGGKPETSNGDFLVDGNKVTIQVPGGMPLVLVKNGKVLEANMMGQILHFEKK